MGPRPRDAPGVAAAGQEFLGEGRRVEPALPRHVACVMDGNGRWAAQRSLPRTAGHEAAESAVIDVIDAAQAAGIEWLSLFAFSTENWQRPSGEIEMLMRLAQRTIRKHTVRVARARYPLPVPG